MRSAKKTVLTFASVITNGILRQAARVEKQVQVGKQRVGDYFELMEVQEFCRRIVASRESVKEEVRREQEMDREA